VLISIDDLRRFTVARNFPKPTTLNRALQQLEFVQADPIRAPARAQDLILRHRVKGYRAGDLERRYTTLDVEEDFFVNYGYCTRGLQTLMHPRTNSRAASDGIRFSWVFSKKKLARMLLEFVRERGVVHPREVDEHFAHGTVTNYWGGSSSATTHLLDAMHYAGLLRIVRREKGIRIYAAHRHDAVPSGVAERRARIDELVDVLVRIYGPVPGSSLTYYVRRLRYAVPHWTKELPGALQRAKERLAQQRLENVDWYWLPDEDITVAETQNVVRLLAPFDPVVHDRDRFEMLWGWSYRFEAYTPAKKRKLGYYALPLLWRDRVIGWANLSTKDGALVQEVGYSSSPLRDRVFKRELDAELDRMRHFLRLQESHS